MNVTTIGPGQAFIDTLAEWLLAQAGADPMALADMEVLLPTRRACRALSDAFLRLTGGRPLLLPRLRPLGDLDEEEMELEAGQPLDLPPAIAPLERQLILARLITAMADSRGGQRPAPDQAARLAGELARLLDAVQAERLDFSRLERLVPSDYAEHWQVTLDFLAILTEVWPAQLAARGVVDPEDRLNRAMAAQLALWRERAPAHPIIAAGSTGSRPATADLLAAVAALPRGMVVLPGLDQSLGDGAWAVLDPPHPQYGLKRLLGRLGIDRAQVRPLADRPDPRATRGRLLAWAMHPAQASEAWGGLSPGAEPARLDGVSRLDAPSPREEAGAIAMMLREALEVPGRTAALVTPDRSLARRVAAEMERWDIRIDDSAGQPLNLSEAGAFLRLTAAMVAEEFAPYPLLATLKHPLSALGRDGGACRTLARRLEVAALRGPRPAPGIAGLRARIDDPRPEGGPASRHPALGALLDDLEALAQPFQALMRAPSAPLADLVRAHMEFAEGVAADDRLPGAARLWAGEAGEAAARFVAGLAAAADAMGPISGNGYPALLDELMAGSVIRSAWEHHPRLHIWGPLEARLQQVDLLILGGLNEGTWPAGPDSDPWMSRPMRAAFGLEPPERRIGLAAHDFAQGFCAPRVVMTRALRVDGTPTVPSRWLMRLDAVMQAAGLVFDEGAAPWMDWHGQLDRPDRVSRPAPPAPCPPVSARPRRLSVTAIETWMRDPYAIYARHILGLRALDPIDADPEASKYGTMVHLALERFCRRWPGVLPPDAEAQLLAIGRDIFDETVASPVVEAFWWPRFVSAARWVLDRERERRPGVSRVHAEVKGALELNGTGGPFTLTAKADRVDQLKDGGLALIDYKTGGVPTASELAAGYAPQLPLEAAIARHGGFEDVAAAEVREMLYWRLKGGQAGGEERALGKDGGINDLASAALDGLRALVDVFDDPSTPYAARPNPEFAPSYSDYGHLARVGEWSSEENDA